MSGPARALIAVAGGLTLYSVLRSIVVPAALHPAANAVVGLTLLVVAHRCGMSDDELGIDRSTLRSGLLAGAAAAISVAALIALVAAIPPSRQFFEDERAATGLAGLLVEVLVIIPLGTVLFEEVVFRGILLGLARRRSSEIPAVWLVAVLFGLWHVPPTLSTASSNATTAGLSSGALAGFTVVVVCAMTVAGAFLGGLRVRSASLAAPVLVHAVANGTAFTAAWLVLHT